jgi:undecaprenyl-diphosphatase
MTVGEGLLLGIVQGITEFLPVSSSGHLVLARTVFTMGSVPLLFDVLLHVATLAVIVLHYRVRIWELIEVTFRYIRRRRRPEDTPQLRFIAVIIVATICTVAIALVLRKTPLAGDNPTMVSVLFLVTAALLASTRYLDRYIQPREGFYMHQALITGIAQGFGTLAGISRSGITITASLYSGMNREQSGEYAFILSIPAVLGALVLSLAEATATQVSVGVIPTTAGFLAAFGTGLLSLKLLLWMVRNAKLWYFSIYLVIVGLSGFFLTV